MVGIVQFVHTDTDNSIIIIGEARHVSPVMSLPVGAIWLEWYNYMYVPGEVYHEKGSHRCVL